MKDKYKVDWSGDGENIMFFSSKNKAYEYLEVCCGVFVEEVEE